MQVTNTRQKPITIGDWSIEGHETKETTDHVLETRFFRDLVSNGIFKIGQRVELPPVAAAVPVLQEVEKEPVDNVVITVKRKKNKKA